MNVFNFVLNSVFVTCIICLVTKSWTSLLSAGDFAKGAEKPREDEAVKLEIDWTSPYKTKVELYESAERIR